MNKWDKIQQQFDDLENAALKQRPSAEINWLDEMHGTAASLTQSGYELEALASAFYRTGNEKVGDQLALLGRRLQIAGENVSHLTGLKINEQYHDSMTSTSTMLMGIVGGLKLAGDETTAVVAGAAFSGALTDEHLDMVKEMAERAPEEAS